MDRFAFGVVAALGTIMAIQDWYGLEGYIEFVRSNWIELPWFVGATILVAGTYFGLRSVAAEKESICEPIAWMVVNDGGQDCFVTTDPKIAEHGQRALPLYTGKRPNCEANRGGHDGK